MVCINLYFSSFPSKEPALYSLHWLNFSCRSSFCLGAYSLGDWRPCVVFIIKSLKRVWKTIYRDNNLPLLLYGNKRLKKVDSNRYGPSMKISFRYLGLKYHSKQNLKIWIKLLKKESHVICFLKPSCLALVSSHI